MILKSTKPIETAEEIIGLKACLNDLMGVLALPAIWAGRDQGDILSTLLDGTRRLLELHFVYASIHATDNKRIEMIRMADTDALHIDSCRLRKTLKKWLEVEPQARPSAVRLTGENSAFGLASFNFGLDERIGGLVAGSTRLGFPNNSERLLLSVAANEAAAGLREAQLLSDRGKAAQELGLRATRKKDKLENTSRQLGRESKLREAAEEALGLLELRHSEAPLTPATEKARSTQNAELQLRYTRLTPREREVLPFVVAGRLSKQTAADLGVSEITVRVHRGQIMRKMQAQSLAALIRMADALGVQQLSGSFK